MNVPTVICMRIKYIQDCAIAVIVLAGGYQLAGHRCSVIPDGLFPSVLIPVGIEDYRQVLN